MPNAWFQESGDWKLWHGSCVFMKRVLLFPAFVSSLFSTKHFQAKVSDNIFCSGSGFRDKTLYNGNLLTEHRFIEQAAYSSSFGRKKRSYLFPLINASPIRAGTPLIRAVRRAAVIML